MSLSRGLLRATFPRDGITHLLKTVVKSDVPDSLLQKEEWGHTSVEDVSRDELQPVPLDAQALQADYVLGHN